MKPWDQSQWQSRILYCCNVVIKSYWDDVFSAGINAGVCSGRYDSLRLGFTQEWLNCFGQCNRKPACGNLKVLHGSVCLTSLLLWFLRIFPPRVWLVFRSRTYFTRLIYPPFGLGGKSGPISLPIVYIPVSSKMAQLSHTWVNISKLEWMFKKLLARSCHMTCFYLNPDGAPYIWA